MVPEAVAATLLVAPPAGMPSRRHWPGGRAPDSNTQHTPRCVQALLLSTSASTAEKTRCGLARGHQGCLIKPDRGNAQQRALRRPASHLLSCTVLGACVRGVWGLHPMGPLRQQLACLPGPRQLATCSPPATAAAHGRAAGWLRPGPCSPIRGPPDPQYRVNMPYYPPERAGRRHHPFGAVLIVRLLSRLRSHARCTSAVCTPGRPAATSKIDRSRAGALRYRPRYGKDWAMAPEAAGATSLVAPPAGMPSRRHWPGDRVPDSRTTAHAAMCKGFVIVDERLDSRKDTLRPRSGASGLSDQTR